MSSSIVDTIKCGRIVYELKKGDTIMDNGACLQLISRRVRIGFNSYSPTVSKKAFIEFKNNKRVVIDTDHSYGEHVTLYKYN